MSEIDLNKEFSAPADEDAAPPSSLTDTVWFLQYGYRVGDDGELVAINPRAAAAFQRTIERSLEIKRERDSYDPA
jgi:hypothetical protein